MPEIQGTEAPPPWSCSHKQCLKYKVQKLHHLGHERSDIVNARDRDRERKRIIVINDIKSIKNNETMYRD